MHAWPESGRRSSKMKCDGWSSMSSATVTEASRLRYVPSSSRSFPAGASPAVQFMQFPIAGVLETQVITYEMHGYIYIYKAQIRETGKGKRVDMLIKWKIFFFSLERIDYGYLILI